MDGNLFTRTVKTVWENPSEYEAIVQNIVAKIRNEKDTLKPGEINKRFIDVWRDSKNPKELIVIAWLLTDSAIRTGKPKVDKALAIALTETMFEEDKSLNPEPLQSWIRSAIFCDEDSKRRLSEALMAMAVPDETMQEKGKAGAVRKKEEEPLEPKPPEFLQELLWFWIYGKKHWKLIIVGAIVLIVLFFLRGYIPRLLSFTCDTARFA